ncbi:MAG: hypothetical protein R3B68_14255 [Phycisphaerales bacterium]
MTNAATCAAGSREIPPSSTTSSTAPSTCSTPITSRIVLAALALDSIRSDWTFIPAADAA